MSTSLFPPADSRKSSKSLSSSQSPTFALAQAALGLGLPHVLPRVSASSSSSEANTVAFAAPVSVSETRLPRRVKSSHKLKGVSGSERPNMPETLIVRRRSRGLSLGTASFLNFSSSDAKGKSREPAADPQVPQKSVTRKTSFWSRKKSISSEIPVLPRSSQHADSLFLPLPIVHSSPPLIVNSVSSSSEDNHNFSSQHVRGLSRSHSERSKTSHPASPSTTTPVPTSKLSPKLRRLPRRPVTADSLARSTVMVPRPLESINRVPSSPITASPRGSEDTPYVSEPEAIQALKPPPHTNPPLLHRLSLNLFHSSPADTSNELIPSASSSNSSRPSLHKEIPKPRVDEESPEVYVSRLAEAVSKGEIAAVLASRFATCTLIVVNHLSNRVL